MSRKDTFNRIVPVILFVLFTAGGSGWSLPQPSNAEEPREIYAFGSGPAELLLFTDYFCPPCQKIEPYLEVALPELLQAGVRITFVDMPVHDKTQLYARYFLYAAKAAGSFEEVMQVRRMLFEIAKTKAVKADREMVEILKEKNIKLSFLNVQELFDQWSGLIKRFGVESTPTCIVTRPGREILVFSGNRGIPEGLDRLRSEMSGTSRTAGHDR